MEKWIHESMEECMRERMKERIHRGVYLIYECMAV